MKFSFDIDQRLFKLIGYSLVIITIVITLGVVGVAYMDYEYFKFKTINKNHPYIYSHQSQESVET